MKQELKLKRNIIVSVEHGFVLMIKQKNKEAWLSIAALESILKKCKNNKFTVGDMMMNEYEVIDK